MNKENLEYSESSKIVPTLDNNEEHEKTNLNVENKDTFGDLPIDITSTNLIDAETYSIHDSSLDSDELNDKSITDGNSLSFPSSLTETNSETNTSEVETSPLIPEWANQTDNPAFFQNLDIPTFLRKLGSNRPRQ